MSRTVCLIPGCPRFAMHRGRCLVHRQGTAARGYGGPHQAARAVLARFLPMLCAYGCGMTISQLSFVAAHLVDGDGGAAGWIAACGTCNERAKHGDAHPVAGSVVVRRDANARGGWAIGSLQAGTSVLTCEPNFSSVRLDDSCSDRETPYPISGMRVIG